MVRDLANDTSLQRYYRLMLYAVKLLSDKKYYQSQLNKKEPQFDFFDYDEENIDEDIDLDDHMKNDMLDVLMFEQQLANVS